MQCSDRYGGMYVAPVSMTLWPGKSKDPGLMPVPDKSDDDVLITDCTVAPALWPSQWKMAIFDPPPSRIDTFLQITNNLSLVIMPVTHAAVLTEFGANPSTKGCLASG